MSWDLLSYLSFYVFALGGLLCSQVINPNDPFETTGPYLVQRFSEEIPFDYNGDGVLQDAEIFIPLLQPPDAFVLFMTGFGASYDDYDDYLLHLTSHGFLVLGLNFEIGGSDPTDGEHNKKAFQALDAIKHIQLKYPEYEGLPIYTAGHSLGGKIAFYAATLDTTIAGVLALDPSNAGGPPCSIDPHACDNYPVAPNPETKQEGRLDRMSNTTSSLIFRSAPDPFSNPEEQFNARNFYYGLDGAGSLAVPSPAWYYDFGRFPHSLYIPDTPSKQVQIIKRTMVAFLEQEVRGADVEAYLTGNIIQSDIEEGRLVSVDSR